MTAGSNRVHRPSSVYGSFDPSGPALEDTLYGLPNRPNAARAVVLPVPFEATTSYRQGTASAPALVRIASQQVELWDIETGSPWQAGIAMAEEIPEIEQLNATACRDAALARDGDSSALTRVNQAGERLNDIVEGWTADRLSRGQLPIILGGDHAVALGALRAATRFHEKLGVLQVDAHADLRDAYEDFKWSHASVIFNLLQESGNLEKLVQVGIRDQCEEEWQLVQSNPLVEQWTDQAVGDALSRGESWQTIVERIIEPLPEKVWITFDIDGLSPDLCPNTGTPVPGGLSWHQTLTLLAALGRSGRTVVGFDLCEVGQAEWDANVGARLLYKLFGWAIRSQTADFGDSIGRS